MDADANWQCTRRTMRAIMNNSTEGQSKMAEMNTVGKMALSPFEQNVRTFRDEGESVTNFTPNAIIDKEFDQHSLLKGKIDYKTE